MKQFSTSLCFSLMILAGISLSSKSIQAQTPVAKNGQLRVIGTKLCNQFGNPIQLRGMSTHGIQWYYQCLTDASLDALAFDWGADILRISLYVQEDGYETDPAGFTAKVTSLINKATARGMYALVDWHQLTPGDPNANLDNAKRFFTDIANAHKDKVNIIYDICNEPNGVAWSRIKTYADQIIPVIRTIDNNAPIFIGTHGWASLGISDGRTAQDIVSNPVNFSNIMYTFHFYAASHGDRYLQELDWASDRLPIFVTEFGSQTASGDGTNNFTMTQRYIDLMRTKKIGWTNWNYSDDFRSGAVWKAGTCGAGPWTVTQLKPAGVWVRERMLTPADDFPGGTTIPPTVNITSPTSGSSFTAPANVTINANAADADGTVSKVEFFQNGVKLGEDLTSPYSFAWSNVAAGSYNLTAKATDNAGLSTTSSTVAITVTTAPATLPAPWTNRDIGTVSPAGNASFSNGIFTARGAGADIWGTADAFHYVYQPISGNVEIVARVNSLTNTNAWAKAGVMIRESLTSGSTHAMVVATPGNGVSFQRRTTTGGTSTSTASTGTIPVWVKISRSGSTFTASRSTDGVTWTTIGTTTITMATNVFVGMAVTSHANGTLTTAAFGNVSVTGANAAPTVSITAPAANTTFTAPATVNISADAADTDGTIAKVEFFQNGVKLGEDLTSPYAFTWSNVAAGSYSLTARATDNGGAATTSGVVPITVQAAPACPAVIASADDGNVAANVLDNNLATRWSASGDGQWIQFCLSNTSSITGVQIAFYKGNERQSIFDVLVSSDASTWTNAATGLRSSGTSLSLQTFSFAAKTGKYVRIVGHGNTLNAWNSYTEVRINASTAASTAITQTVMEEKTAITSLQSYPNPFKGNSTVVFNLDEAGQTNLSVYDITGKQVVVLVNKHLSEGTHRATFKADNIASGVYMIKLTQNGKTIISKIVKE